VAHGQRGEERRGYAICLPQRGTSCHSRLWMQNTVLPLDIMYFTAKNKLVTIAEGKPFDEKSLPASEDYQYVIEMKQGSAKRLGIKTGATIDIPADLKKAQ